MILDIAYPDEAELTRIVRRVIAGGTPPLDDVISKRLFNGHPRPAVWGEWPPEAVRTWSRACQLYYDLLQEQEQASWVRGSRNDLTLIGSWEAVFDVAPDRRHWWQIPGVTWAVLGEVLGTSARLASYRMTRLGWRLTGSGMNVPDRRIVEAPCVCCGQTWTPNDIREKHGPCCG